MSEETILEGLKSEGVVSVKRVISRKSDQPKQTPLLILTFHSSQRPTNIYAGYVKYAVSAYIPNPLRCYNCQSFGHSSNSCRKEARCNKCGKTPHGETPCDSPVYCLHCKSSEHICSSTQCPIWRNEKEICRIQATTNISFQQARKEFNDNRPKADPLYSTIAHKRTTVSIATQTEPIPQLSPLIKLTPIQPTKNTNTTQTEVIETVESNKTHQQQAEDTGHSVSLVEPILEPYSFPNQPSTSSGSQKHGNRIPKEHNYSNIQATKQAEISGNVKQKLVPDIEILSEPSSDSDGCT